MSCTVCTWLQNDPFSANVSTNAVCGRGDVNPLYPKAAGTYARVRLFVCVCVYASSCTLAVVLRALCTLPRRYMTAITCVSVCVCVCVCVGCYDSKVADWAMACALQASVTNGPPYGPGMVPFQWDTSAYALTVPHVGQPNRFAFGWDQVAPTHTQAARSSASVS